MGSLFDADAENDENGFAAEDRADETGAEIDAAPADLPPRANPDLLGHEAVEKSLLADFAAGRMPHALILAGPSGIGKATLAFRLARFLLAQGADEQQGGGLFGDAAPPENLYTSPENPVFRRVASGGHADLMTVEREMDEKKGRLKNDISVESVRRIHPFLRRTAAEGGWRTVIVDGAEHMNASSQNALLKVLEEPPRKAVLILTTAQPGGFLPTVRSRCRLVRMELLEEKTLSALLARMAPGAGEAERSALSRMAQGSIGRALQYHRNGGVALYRELLKTVTDLPRLDLVAVHELAEKTGRSGAEDAYEAAREILTGWCARTCLAQARNIRLPDVVPGDGDIFARIMTAYPPRHFLDTQDKMARMFLQAEHANLDKRLALISAFLMLQQPDYQGLNV